mmetsp:Transcript_58091/g.173368  ORF Transcript_58091/g.173368 Transcript_58091/m.173368 type:complete len:229 (-) Transcript_58091:529-1215(-)
MLSHPTMTGQFVSLTTTVIVLLFLLTHVSAERSFPSCGIVGIRGGSRAAAIEGLKNSVASGLASACAKTLLQPFDTIKTVQQQHRSSGGGLSLADAVKVLIERGGIGELYAGLAVSAIGSMPAIGIYYGFYSYGKRTIIPWLQSSYGSVGSEPNKGERHSIISGDTLKLIGVALAAALGNTVASFSRVPYEVVKQNLQTEGGTTLKTISSMFKSGGMRSFFPLGGVSI